MARCGRLLCLLLVRTVLAAASASVDNQRHLVLIPLESDDHLRFTGVVRVGSPPRSVRVVFDTGSSDTWVTRDLADDRQAGKAFTIAYGGGIVSGLAARTALQLGRGAGSDATGLLLRHVPVGVVDGQTAGIPGLPEAQGVVGLGMQTLARIHSNSCLLGLLTQQRSAAGPVVFSLYISSSAGAQPASQLIFGGDDPALMSANTTWFSFPVISHDALRVLHPVSQSAQEDFGFWALRLQRLSIGNVILPLRPNSPHNGAALLDSGTSVLLLPQDAFDGVVQELFSRLGKRLLLSPNEQRAPPACRPCHAHEFPPLAFDLLLGDGTKPGGATTQRFELQASDYVRCDQRRRECTAMIDTIHSSEISDHLGIVVLGTVFFRVYYAHFDSTNKKVRIACTLNENGLCLGGLQPALDYRGQHYESDSEAPLPGPHLVGICAAATALALLAGLRMML